MRGEGESEFKLSELLTVLCGDWAEQLASLPGQSVDFILTSPPYDNARTYGGHKWEFEGGALQMFRVLKDGGVCCWNVNDMTVDGSETLTSCKQKIFFREVCGFRIHDTMIWEKVHVGAPNAAQYHQMFEYVFVLSKGKPKTFNPIEDRKNIYGGKSPFSYNSKRQANGDIKKTRECGICAEYGRRGNVWKGNSRAQEDPCAALPHPAMMPKWLARDLILSWSNTGDTVLDPMAGSGTVCREAISNARKSIAIDVNQEYCDLIRQQCDITPGLPLHTSPR